MGRRLLLLLLVGLGAGDAGAVPSATGRYRVSLAARVDPIPINELHQWIIHVERVDGGRLRLRDLTLDGGMPAHGHGLPTVPTLAAGPAAGDFIAEGVRFNMAGRWELRVLLADAAGIDQAVFSFEVGATPSPGGELWSESERATLRSLWIGSLGPVPPDRSNAVADDPRAVALGHRLFFDAGLSRDGKTSCATCHDPDRDFTDGRPRARGANRNTPSLVGAGYQRWLFWDGRRDSLWSQALSPIENPAEMNSSRLEAVRHLARRYRAEYAALFGPLPDPTGRRQDAVNRAFANLGKALAAYERRLRPGPSAFDRYVEALLAHRAPAGLSPPAVRGLKMFISSDGQCLKCHNGPLFSNGGFHNIGTGILDGDTPDFGRSIGIQAVLATEFNCLGPYNDDRERACPELQHLNRHEENGRLVGAYKVPSLRNVAATAPYMHDGRFPSLAEAIGHYRRPARMSKLAEFRPLFDMTPGHVAALGAFLEALSAPVDAPPALLRAPEAFVARGGKR